VVSRCYLAALPGHLVALPRSHPDLTYVASRSDLQVAWALPGFGGYQ